jgi:hypothetical protein
MAFIDPVAGREREADDPSLELTELCSTRHDSVANR